MSEHHGEEMVVDHRDDVCDQDFQAETDHPLQGLERYVERRAPGRSHPEPDGIDGNRHDILDGNTQGNSHGTGQ